MRRIYRYPINFWRRLGPGLITGAADDDPSGIATYSQVGAQFGYSVGWTMLFSYPLMVATQQIAARIGRTTSLGLAGNLRRYYPIMLLRAMVALLLLANTINLGADLGAMGSAANLVGGGNSLVWTVIFGVVCFLAQMFLDYRRYIIKLKWLTLSLFAYVGVVLIVKMPWHEVAVGLFLPRLHADPQYLAAIVAVFGTTISPYMFFWQSTQEVEEINANPAARALRLAPEHAERENRRIRFDTWVGMGFSNIIALFIILTTAATLNANGVTDIQTSSQAAQALRPIAGELAFAIFAIGIVGTGLLAVPILAASSAYALGEALQWPVGLSRQPREAKAFYATLGGASILGIALNFTAIDPIKALYWAAIINGVIAVPLMFVMMHMAASAKVMGKLVIPRSLKGMGWLSTIVMTVIVLAMIVTSF